MACTRHPMGCGRCRSERKSGDVAFTVNEDGVMKLYLIAHGSEPRCELALPLGVVAGLEFLPMENTWDLRSR